MPHPAARAVPIALAAAALGLKVTGSRAHCVNAVAHEGGVDRHPSLIFFADSNRYKCFACGVGGDLIDLVRVVKRYTFTDAVKWLQALAQGNLGDRGPVAPYERRTSAAPDKQAQAVYAALYRHTSQIGLESAAATYLRGRGLDYRLAADHGATEIIDSPGLWRVLTQEFGAERVRAAGLVSNSGSFLFARHRLLFFYQDHGSPVFVQARDIDGQAGCKELALAGLVSPIPYNADLLHIPRQHVCLCEGCIDTLSAVQLGLPAVGVPGVQTFRSEWFELFRRVANVHLCFDNDDPGRRHSAELRTQFRLRGIKADVYHPTGVKDMNDLLLQQLGAQRQ